MPELPEVEATVRKLRHLVGFEITNYCVLAPTVVKSDLHQVQNQQVLKVERFGKNIGIILDSSVLHIHQMLSGRVIVGKSLIHENCQVYFILSNGETIQYLDARKYGRVKVTEAESFYQQMGLLGPEIWSLTSGEFADRLAHKIGQSKDIKSVLLDQKFVAGIGNIYAAEILFRAKINPLRIVSSFTMQEVHSLYTSIILVLDEAIDRVVNRPSTLSGGYKRNLPYYYVYKVDTCRVCNTDIKSVMIGPGKGRSTYFCPVCQK